MDVLSGRAIDPDPVALFDMEFQQGDLELLLKPLASCIILVPSVTGKSCADVVREICRSSFLFLIYLRLKIL